MNGAFIDPPQTNPPIGLNKDFYDIPLNLGRYESYYEGVASLHKDPHGRSPYWYVAFTLADGRRAFRSTRQVDRRKAAEVARTVEKAAQAARCNELTEAHVRKWMDELLESTGQSPVRNITVRSFAADWLSGKRLVVNHATARRYEHAVELFLSGLGARADKPLGGITPADIAAYRDARLEEKVAGATLGQYIKAIRSLLGSARRQGLLLTNPAEAVEMPRERAHERSIFSVAELRALLGQASPEWTTLALLGWFTGARLSDLARLDWEAVDLLGGTITFAQGKTGAKVVVPIHPELGEHLGRMAGDCGGPLCPVLSVTPSTGRDGLSQQFIGLMRAAGIDPQIVKTSKHALPLKSFHSLRHSFTSALANAGVPADQRMRLTGHKSAKVHQVYTHHEMETLRGAIQTLPRLTEQ
jgi:integrase